MRASQKTATELRYTDAAQIHTDQDRKGKRRKDAGPSNVVMIVSASMQIERVLMNLKTEELKKMFRFDKSESTEYIGRAVAALAADSKVMAKTGTICFVADLAQEYGFSDVDGRTIPRFHPTD